MTLFRNYQAPLQILRKYSGNTLDTRNTFESLRKVSGHSSNYSNTFQTLFWHLWKSLDALSKHSQDTLWKHSWTHLGNSVNTCSMLSKTLRQLSGHSGNFLETHLDTETLFGNPQWTLWMLRKHSRNSLDTVNILWKPSVNSWTLWNFLKYPLECSLRNSQATLQTLTNLLKTLLDTGNTIWKPSVNTLDTLWKFTKYFPDALSETLRQHPDTQETFWKLTETLETLFGNPQATFRTLRKCSGNSLGHWKHLWKPSVNLLDTLRLLKILAGCSFRNSQATLQTLMKPSENSLRHRKHHLKAFSELSGHTLEIHQIFPRCLFQKLSGNIPDTQETFQKLTETLETLFGNPQATFRTLRKCSGNSLGHWKHPLETLSQLLDTLRLLKILAGCSFRNSQATLQTLRKPSENSLRHQKPVWTPSVK